MQNTSKAFNVGSVECLAVTDGTLALPASGLFFNAPEADLDVALHQHGITDRRVPLPFNPLVLRTAGKTILVDSGYGPGVAPTLGHLTENLAAAGIGAGDVDIVLLSHAHADHAGGAVTSDGVLAFPKARILLNRAEAEYWMSDTAMAKDAPRTAAARSVLGAIWNVMESIEPGDEVVPGVALVVAAGHTPNNMAVRVESDGKTLLYVADAVAHPIHLEHPDWHIQADHDPAGAVAARLALLEQAARENALLSGYHLPLPGIIRVHEQADGRWMWEAA